MKPKKPGEGATSASSPEWVEWVEQFLIGPSKDCPECEGDGFIYVDSDGKPVEVCEWCSGIGEVQRPEYRDSFQDLSIEEKKKALGYIKGAPDD